MYGREKKEFGDYQTPISFCYDVCKYIQKEGFVGDIDAIFDPTCGIGNFLRAAYSVFCIDKVYGIEINEGYVHRAQRLVPTANVQVGNIFGIKTKHICKTDNVLLVGNPPWATNANQVYNIPPKNNFKGKRGIDALTGSSNFDICEYIILQLLNEYNGTSSTICMLCKTSVARNILLEIDRNDIFHERIEMLYFDNNKVFGVAAHACIFAVKLSRKSAKKSVTCTVKNFANNTLLDTLVVADGKLKSLNTKIDLEGNCQLTWRSGVKHDCSKVMELDIKDGILRNKQNSIVDIEQDLIFPLVKSSDFKRPVLTEFSKYVIVTQKRPKQDTLYIREQYPRTWGYLNSNLPFFSRRKSAIYKNSPQFSMFGIGEYSFAPYKVGLSGFYKKPLFCLLYSDIPVMVDDTSYFLAFSDYNKAYTMMLLLNSSIVQDFLLSIAFLDNKRPYTAKILSRLDLNKCIDAVSFDKIESIEKKLKLKQYISYEVYFDFINFIKEERQM